MILQRPEAWQGFSFDDFMQMSGTLFRQQPGRKTLRTMIQGQAYFIKIHTGVGWREIFKNLISLRLPIIGASNEWQALALLAKIKVPSLQQIAFGRRGNNPASQQSFIVTRELVATVSLEEVCAAWRQQPPQFAFKLNLIKHVADIARLIHTHGLNHRDFYICHFLIDAQQAQQQIVEKLYLIDLHRAQIRNSTPLRWRIKDLAGLYFSAMDCGLTKRDLLRFVKWYQPDWRAQTKLWLAVERKAKTLYRKVHGRHYG